MTPLRVGKCKINLKAVLLTFSSMFRGVIYGSSLFFKTLQNFRLKAENH